MRLLRSAGVIVLCFLSAAMVLLFSWLPRGGVYPWVSRNFWGPGLLWLAGAKLHVHGSSDLPKGAPCIYYANHQSLYDIPALCPALPQALYFVAKKEILKVPVFGWGMWAIGMVFVDRSNPDRARISMQKAVKAIQKGKHILAFPEGTRSRSGELQGFKKGIIHVAKNGQIPMVPIAIVGSKEVLGHDGKLRKGVIHVRIGTSISAEQIGSMNIRELNDMAHRKLAELIEVQMHANGNHEMHLKQDIKTAKTTERV